MSEVLVKGVLVQGEVTFKVNIDTLVDPDTYADDEKLSEFLAAMALSDMVNTDEEIDIYNTVDVAVTIDTFKKHALTIVSDEDWNKIIKEKNMILGK